MPEALRQAGSRAEALLHVTGECSRPFCRALLTSDVLRCSAACGPLQTPGRTLPRLALWPARLGRLLLYTYDTA